MSESELYRGREQTLVKHFILRKYLERFALIVGSFADSITYIDCFSGPWNVRSNDLKDSSFAIALEELRNARHVLSERGKALKIRCMFLEKASAPYARLEAFAAQVNDAEVKTENQELAGSIDSILSFIKGGGRRTFPFVFIDPTAWTGFEMSLTAPLLKQQPGEVLINFMTDYIRRFIDHPDQQTREQFVALLGSDKVRDELLALADPQDREDALFRAYAERVRQTGGFSHTCVAIVLYPEIDRRYFHLIYATRNRRGVEVFKDAEQRAMEIQDQTRAEAKQRKRVKKTLQREFFGAEEMVHSRPIDMLRTRYLDHARKRVLEQFQANQRVPYEQALDAALAFPLVWQQDLKEWISEWQRTATLIMKAWSRSSECQGVTRTTFWCGKVEHRHELLQRRQ